MFRLRVLMVTPLQHRHSGLPGPVRGFSSSSISGAAHAKVGFASLVLRDHTQGSQACAHTGKELARCSRRASYTGQSRWMSRAPLQALLRPCDCCCGPVAIGGELCAQLCSWSKSKLSRPCANPSQELSLADVCSYRLPCSRIAVGQASQPRAIWSQLPTPGHWARRWRHHALLLLAVDSLHFSSTSTAAQGSLSGFLSDMRAVLCLP